MGWNSFGRSVLVFYSFFDKRFRKPHTYLLANPVQYGFGQHGFFDGTFVMEGTFCTFCYLNHILHNANLEMVLKSESILLMQCRKSLTSTVSTTLIQFPQICYVASVGRNVEICIH